jgi:corrinoid protein of di/trimethylamine methyltransferase
MNEGVLEELKGSVLAFERDKAEAAARRAIEQGLDPLKCAEALSDGLRIIGDRFRREEIFLPELFGASQVVKAALCLITDEIRKQGKNVQGLGKVVIGTVFGDIHSIGKDIVATLLFAEGFEVIDLGVNVKAEAYLKAVNEHKPNILALSALLTTTAMEQKNVIEGLKKAGIRDQVKVLVGGSPINQEFAHRIGADGYGATGPEGVKVARKLMGQ